MTGLQPDGTLSQGQLARPTLTWVVSLPGLPCCRNDMEMPISSIDKVVLLQDSLDREGREGTVALHRQLNGLGNEVWNFRVDLP